MSNAKEHHKTRHETAERWRNSIIPFLERKELLSRWDIEGLYFFVNAHEVFGQVSPKEVREHREEHGLG